MLGSDTIVHTAQPNFGPEGSNGRGEFLQLLEEFFEILPFEPALIIAVGAGNSHQGISAEVDGGTGAVAGDVVVPGVVLGEVVTVSVFDLGEDVGNEREFCDWAVAVG